jgi:hypothetical protein
MIPPEWRTWVGQFVPNANRAIDRPVNAGAVLILKTVISPALMRIPHVAACSNI